MQKILILWLGAFGFAVAKHLGENNPDITIYASEINQDIYSSISETRKHPYFFEWVKLPENIELIPDMNEILPEIEIIISIIPCQFIGDAFSWMKENLKPGVTILNLSKWIDNSSMQTVSEKLKDILMDTSLNSLLPGEMKPQTYTYAYLAGGMIAQELVDTKQLGADIVTEDAEVWEALKTLFQSDFLDINLKIWNTKNTELYAALKNIVALILGYYEWQWAGASTLGYYLTGLLKEMKWVIELLHTPLNSPLTGEMKSQDIDFTDYALCWDIIATCFGWSRNRLLGNMLGEWKEISQALTELKKQKKIAEWYETLKWVYKLTAWKDWFKEINKFGKKYV